MKKFVKMLAGTASRVASSSVNFAKRHTAALAVGMMCLAGSAMAEGSSANYAIVSKEASGAVTFTPENLATPIIDALIAGYKAWGIVALVIIGASLIVYILKKK